MEINGLNLRIKGKVQGVGFRPYVWQLAHRFGLYGDVSNDSAGVTVHLWQSSAVTDFYTPCREIARHWRALIALIPRPITGNSRRWIL